MITAMSKVRFEIKESKQIFEFLKKSLMDDCFSVLALFNRSTWPVEVSKILADTLAQHLARVMPNFIMDIFLIKTSSTNSG